MGFLPPVGWGVPRKIPWLLSLEARREGAAQTRPVLVHEDVYASTDEHGIVFWQWTYIRGSVEGSLLWKLSVQDSFSLNNISTSCGQERWKGLMAIFYNPPDSFQIFQFMSREGISTAICYQEVKKVSSHPTKSLWSLKSNTSGVISSDFSVALGQQLTGCSQTSPFLLGKCFCQSLELGEHMGWQGSLFPMVSLSLMVSLSILHMGCCLGVPWILHLWMLGLLMSKAAVMTLCSCR